MSTTRSHGHPSLPAPVIHAGFSTPQSKSHVLAGVQDAYWSDDDVEDAECPLCLEEMDISDLNFKPCVCGYQICRFCWHHIKENLNGRCPACRREYTDEAVQFKAIAKEDHKRLTQQKKQRERERKDLEALGRRQLANVRVVQRNVVYVVGIGPRFAKEELIPTLRSNEYFGQYGKISKILLVKRTPPGGGNPVVGLYITYHRREDAARCIAAVDGTPSPGGGREVVRTSYGTTKYCMAFLRGVSSLPRTAAWGQKVAQAANTSPALHNNIHVSGHHSSAIPRSSRRGAGVPRQGRNATSSAHHIAAEPRPSTRGHHDRKGGSVAGSTKAPSVASSSRPSTPAAPLLPQRPATPPDVKSLRQKESHVPLPPRSPTSSVAIEFDIGSGSQDLPPSPAPRPQSTVSVQSSVPSVPPSIPDVPPGLPAPSKAVNTDGVAPQSIQSSQSSYQMSIAARALLDDVKARRESVVPVTVISPFPDFDRTLQTLSGDDSEFGGFSFNLDPKLAGDDVDLTLLDFESEANVPFSGNFVEAFPALKTPGQQPPRTVMVPPGLGFSQSSARPIYDPLSMRSTPIEKQPTGNSNYTGSFNPFADAGENASVTTNYNSTPDLRKSSQSTPDEERKVSRFDFARGRQGSTVAASSLNASSPLSRSDSPHSFFPDSSTPSSQPQWQLPIYHSYSQTSPNVGSPLAQHAPISYSPQQHHRFQQFDTGTGVSEAQLRELIQSSRDRTPSVRSGLIATEYKYAANQPFHDPAIMSARLASPVFYQYSLIHH
ncbi:hypothetical protein SERLA73DRAFT_125032 [Serpula lacrymans var. lacrymans S7.3]|uniref:RING-type domain-containing protein n=1 Tax=Serpula lacrymans var. lacrymans (strain S7.3) TaxID=936435 RepID=F8Q6F3_SERL3|nr:hypothetical protein SERLA73DRAFT_125032 [Serpula lacrymans var. lacrymans S7.3]